MKSSDCYTTMIYNASNGIFKRLICNQVASDIVSYICFSMVPISRQLSSERLQTKSSRCKMVNTKYSNRDSPNSSGFVLVVLSDVCILHVLDPWCYHTWHHWRILARFVNMVLDLAKHCLTQCIKGVFAQVIDASTTTLIAIPVERSLHQEGLQMHCLKAERPRKVKSSSNST